MNPAKFEKLLERLEERLEDDMTEEGRAVMSSLIETARRAWAVVHADGSAELVAALRSTLGELEDALVRADE
jgi:hypothetical protein